MKDVGVLDAMHLHDRARPGEISLEDFRRVGIDGIGQAQDVQGDVVGALDAAGLAVAVQQRGIAVVLLLDGALGNQPRLEAELVANGLSPRQAHHGRMLRA